MSDWVLGVIGGSGLYQVDGLEGGKWVQISTPWGAPSDAVFQARLHGVQINFLPRHGRGHVQTPSSINYRANMDALKQLGCTDVLSLSAAGSLKEVHSPGDFVVVDQYIDRTFAREKSFFGPGCVGHVPFGHPTCQRLGAMVADAAEAAGANTKRGGTYLCMEGPQFSTRAESELYRSWGCDVIGMTNMPEAKLAREAEMSYVSVAMITDYDCWHPDYGDVDIADIIQTLGANTSRAQALIKHLAVKMSDTDRTPTEQGIESCLDFAIMTAPEARDPELVSKLRHVAGRVLS